VTCRLLLTSLLLAGCVTTKNTPQQDRTWAAASICSTKYPSVQVDRVMPDGKYYFRTSQWSSEFQLYQSCMAQEYQRLDREGR
jgi:hypothetical protein